MSEQKRALIIGQSGQAGYYLTKLLLEKGYKVFGTVRRHSFAEGQDNRLQEFAGKFESCYMDLTDKSSIDHVLQNHTFDEIYNLGAMSFVQASFTIPIYTAEANSIGVLNLLESIRVLCPKTKMITMSSSEMFGNNKDVDGYNRETTPLFGVSPYAASKIFAHNLCHIYRDSYNMFIPTAICHNYESKMRGSQFVTSKIVKGACLIKAGLENTLALGNLQASRDWTHAYDTMRGVWMIMQHDKPDTFLLSSNETRTIEEFCSIVFQKLDMNYKDYVVYNSKFARPNELHVLKGDSTKARTILGWTPEISFDSLVEEMIEFWKKKIEDGCLVQLS